VLHGNCEIGAGTRIYPFVTIGLAPQHRGDDGKAGRVVIGGNCVIREHVTIHRGTDGGNGTTRVGADCYLMVGSHIAHDCVVGNHVTMANNATLGGHVTLGDGVYIGGLSAVHQNLNIGRLTMIGGVIGIRRNVVPFSLIVPNNTYPEGALRGPNIVGLRRNGYSRSAIRRIDATMRFLFNGRGSLGELVEEAVVKDGDDQFEQEIVAFVRDRLTRGFIGADFRDGP
jgi:UDP-N-acetylglucosamine acyltransferase